MTEQAVVIGVFREREAVKPALQALQQAGFGDEQLGFAARSTSAPQTSGTTTKKSPGAFFRGIMGGILGAADILLIPITGPSDAEMMLQSALPSLEEAIDIHSGRATSTPSHGIRPPFRTLSESEAIETDTNTLDENLALSPSTEKGERTSAITGGVVGGAAGAVAALLIPGVGPAVAAGTLAVVLSSAALGSATGSFLGAFISIGLPEQQARHYEHAVRSGNTVVTIKAGARQREAQDILQRYGAQDIQVH